MNASLNLTAWCACALLLTACGGDRAADPDVVRTDSAGIRIVASGSADRDLLWQFERIDVLRDSLGEPWLFTALWPRAVVTDRAGRTYVLTRDPSIVRFGRDGRYERTLGRRGGGPGEMQFPVALGANGDTLFVLDASKMAMVRWGPSFDPVSDMRLDGALERAESIAFRSGGLWFKNRVFGDTAVSIALFGDTMSAPLYQVAVPGGGAVRFKCVSLNGPLPPLFAPDIGWSASGPRIVVNATPEYVIWLHEGARPIASVRRPLPSRAPTIDDVKALYPEGYKISFGGDAPPCIIPAEEVMKQFGVASVLPMVHDLILLSDGTIWVQRSPNNAPPVLDVFASDGAYAGTVRGMRLPLGLLPNGELLVPREDEASGGLVLARMRISR